MYQKCQSIEFILFRLYFTHLYTLFIDIYIIYSITFSHLSLYYFESIIRHFIKIDYIEFVTLSRKLFMNSINEYVARYIHRIARVHKIVDRYWQR